MQLAEKFGYEWQAPSKGEIYLTALHGLHPVIVISNKAYNEDSKNVYVIPLTTVQHPDHFGPRLTRADGVDKPCYAKIDQMEHIKKSDLKEFRGPVSSRTLEMLDEHLRTIFFGPKKPLPRRKK